MDEIIITGSDSSIVATLIHGLQSQFALKDLEELHYFLGIEVYRAIEGLQLS